VALTTTETVSNDTSVTVSFTCIVRFSVTVLSSVRVTFRLTVTGRDDVIGT
jgi:hypothetical protein